MPRKWSRRHFACLSELAQGSAPFLPLHHVVIRLLLLPFSLPPPFSSFFFFFSLFFVLVLVLRVLALVFLFFFLFLFLFLFLFFFLFFFFVFFLFFLLFLFLFLFFFFFFFFFCCYSVLGRLASRFNPDGLQITNIRTEEIRLPLADRATDF